MSRKEQNHRNCRYRSYRLQRQLLQLQAARQNLETQAHFAESVAEGMPVFIRSASGGISFRGDKPARPCARKARMWHAHTRANIYPTGRGVYYTVAVSYLHRHVAMMLSREIIRCSV